MGCHLAQYQENKHVSKHVDCIDAFMEQEYPATDALIKNKVFGLVSSSHIAFGNLLVAIQFK